MVHFFKLLWNLKFLDFSIFDTLGLYWPLETFKLQENWSFKLFRFELTLTKRTLVFFAHRFDELQNTFSIYTVDFFFREFYMCQKSSRYDSSTCKCKKKSRLHHTRDLFARFFAEFSWELCMHSLNFGSVILRESVSLLQFGQWIRIP